MTERENKPLYPTIYTDSYRILSKFLTNRNANPFGV